MTDSKVIKRGVLGREFARRGDWSTGLIQFEGDLSFSRYAGKLPVECKEDYTVDLIGQQVKHPKYGSQFQVDGILRYFPDDTVGAMNWMATYLPQIGPERSKALLQHFGRDIWHVLEHRPDLLSDVKGITEDRAKDIVAAYQKYSSTKQTLIDLVNYGLPMRAAQRAVSMWGADTLEEIKKSPYELYYRLLDSVYVPFEQIDKFALNIGTATDSKERIEAFLLKNIYRETQALGHCAMIIYTLVMQTATELRSHAISKKRIEEILHSSDLFVLKGRYVLESRIDSMENGVAASIADMLHKYRYCTNEEIN